MLGKCRGTLQSMGFCGANNKNTPGVYPSSQNHGSCKWDEMARHQDLFPVRGHFPLNHDYERTGRNHQAIMGSWKKICDDCLEETIFEWTLR